jgi:hypothetical protein
MTNPWLLKTGFNTRDLRRDEHHPGSNDECLSDPMLWLQDLQCPNIDDMDEDRSVDVHPLPEYWGSELARHAGSWILNAGRYQKPHDHPKAFVLNPEAELSISSQPCFKIPE